VERGLPFKAAVGHHFHAEERHREAGEVVIVNGRVDEGCRKADLFLVSVLMVIREPHGGTHLPDVVLHRKFGGPQWCCWPALAIYAVIRHA